MNDGVGVVRAFEEQDREPVLLLLKPNGNSGREAARWSAADAVPTSRVEERLVVGSPPVAYSCAIDRATTVFPKPGLTILNLVVHHGSRGQGIGSALLESAFDFARRRGSRRIRASVGWSDAASQEWFAKRGFVPSGAKRVSFVDLALFGVAEALPFLARAAQSEIQLERARQDAAEAEFLLEVEEDMAGSWSQAPADSVMEIRFAATHGGRVVGLHHIAVAAETWIHYTGTLPSHRRRGVAGALKAAGMLEARLRGVDRIFTGNELDNAAILALNDRMGFVEESSVMLMIRDVP